MALYFLRHGQSTAQADNRFPAPGEDPSLTALGRQQAKKVLPELAALNISEIISSPLKRALQTAEIIQKALRLKTIEIDKRIIEYDVGKLKGKPLRHMTPQILQTVKDTEDPQTFHDRIFDFLRDNHAKPGNVLVVGHSVVARMIETIAENKSAQLFYDVPKYPNAHPILINLDKVKFR